MATGTINTFAVNDGVGDFTSTSANYTAAKDMGGLINEISIYMGSTLTLGGCEDVQIQVSMDGTNFVTMHRIRSSRLVASTKAGTFIVFGRYYRIQLGGTIASEVISMVVKTTVLNAGNVLYSRAFTAEATAGNATSDPIVVPRPGLVGMIMTAGTIDTLSIKLMASPDSTNYYNLMAATNAVQARLFVGPETAFKFVTASADAGTLTARYDLIGLAPGGRGLDYILAMLDSGQKQTSADRLQGLPINAPAAVAAAYTDEHKFNYEATGDLIETSA